MNITFENGKYDKHSIEMVHPSRDGLSKETSKNLLPIIREMVYKSSIIV